MPQRSLNIRSDEAARRASLVAYAVAKVLGLPLLCEGDDFARTDTRPALQP